MLAIGLGVHAHAVYGRLDSLRRRGSNDDIVSQHCRRYAELRPFLPAGGVVGYRSSLLIDAYPGSSRDFTRAMHRVNRGEKGAGRDAAGIFAEAKELSQRMHMAQYCLAPIVLDFGPAIAVGEQRPVDSELLIIDRPRDSSQALEFDTEKYGIRARTNEGLLLLERVR